MHSGRPLFLCGNHWGNPAGPWLRVWWAGLGRPPVQSLASRAGSWNEGQRCRGSQQQRVRTWMSGPGSWTHRCDVSFWLVCFSERGCVSSTINITYSCSLIKCLPETIPWCCLCFPTCWPKSQTSGWLTTCVLPSAGWSWAMWKLSLWSRYIYSSIQVTIILLTIHCHKSEIKCLGCSVRGRGMWGWHGTLHGWMDGWMGRSVRSHRVLSHRFFLLWWLVFPSKRTWRRTRRCSAAWLCSTLTVLLWYSTNTTYIWYCNLWRRNILSPLGSKTVTWAVIIFKTSVCSFVTLSCFQENFYMY